MSLRLLNRVRIVGAHVRHSRTGLVPERPVPSCLERRLNGSVGRTAAVCWGPNWIALAPLAKFKAGTKRLILTTRFAAFGEPGARICVSMGAMQTSFSARRVRVAMPRKTIIDIEIAMVAEFAR